MKNKKQILLSKKEISEILQILISYDHCGNAQSFNRAVRLISKVRKILEL